MEGNGVEKVEETSVSIRNSEGLAPVKEESVSKVPIKSVDPETDIYEYCRIMLVGGMLPARFKSVEAVLSSVMYGKEMGIPPQVAIYNIYAIQGRPVIDYKIINAILQKNGIFSEMIENCSIQVKVPAVGTAPAVKDYRTTVRLTRILKNGNTITEISSVWFSDVQKQVASADTLNKYRETMMRKTAFLKGARWIAADVMCGMQDPQEMMEVINLQSPGTYKYELDEDGNIKI